jgi:20S proteasome alpha/beta subunit
MYVISYFVSLYAKCVLILTRFFQQETGPHLYECSPSANNLEYYAMSIGARSQSAKTYLESKYTEFEDGKAFHKISIQQSAIS